MPCWLKLPFKAVETEGSGGLSLGGPGIPGNGDGGLQTFGEITSFAFAVCKDASLVSPATDRQDIADWLSNPSIASFRPLLKGRQADDGIPCLNSWGLTMDDAKVLPVLKVLLSEADANDEGLLDIRDYVDYNYKKAGMTP